MATWFDKSKLTNENLIKILVMVILYILLGNLNSVVGNPMIEGFAVNIIIIVMAGILFGKEVGLIVGLMGTLINGVITDSHFEYAAIIPYLIMGWLSGKLREKNGLIVSSLAIVVGYALNVSSFLIFKLMSTEDINSTFWKGSGYRTLFGIISIAVLSRVYLKIFTKKNEKKK